MRAKKSFVSERLKLDQIEPLGDGRVRIGAMVSNTDLARHDHIRKHYPSLSQALLSGASTQLRNKATTAGNVMQRVRCGYFRDGVSPCNKRSPGSGCAAIEGLNRNVHAVLGGSPHCIAAHPSGMCVAMVAIGATIHVQGPKGKRDIPFADFHLLPGDTPWKEHALEADEMITHVTLDAPMPGSRSAYVKLRDRGSYQFAPSARGHRAGQPQVRLGPARSASGFDEGWQSGSCAPSRRRTAPPSPGPGLKR